ncbi:MAG: RimK family alpha-L-glutamate ligase [Pseudomonadota bacterium]
MDGTQRALGDPRIAVMVDQEDWHARRLVQAFAARGREAVCLSLTDCTFDSQATHGLRLPGFESRLPAGVFVRCVPGGSFEQVTRRLGVLHALDALGVPLCNGPRAIERCVDKSTTTFRLQSAGLPTPPTWTCEGRASASELVAAEAGPARPLVLKPLFGSQGRGLRLIERPEELPPAEEVDGVYYLQRFIASPDGDWRDWRVLVAGRRPVAAMMRHGRQWITNMHQGAEAEAVALEPIMAKLASQALSAVGAGYGGVDLIRDRHGELLVLEVNSMPAWSGLQKVSSLDITQALADSFLAALEHRSVPAPCQAAAV